MSYSLQLDQDRVSLFLRTYVGLSREGRVRLFANLHSDLRVHGDFYRQDPDRRLGPGSDYFWYHILLKDETGDGRVRQFSFIVNDSAAAFGVLQVDYVEVSEGPA